MSDLSTWQDARVGLLDDLNLDDVDDRSEAVRRLTEANEDWVRFCQSHGGTDVVPGVISDPRIAEDAKCRVADIEEARRLIYEAIDRAIDRL